MQAHADPPDVDALLDAVEAGNADKVRELLDGGDVGVNDSDADGGENNSEVTEGAIWVDNDLNMWAAVAAGAIDAARALLKQSPPYTAHYKSQGRVRSGMGAEGWSLARVP